MDNLGILIKYEWKKLFQKKLVRITLLCTLLLLLISNLAFLAETTELSVINADESTTKKVLNGYQYMQLRNETAWKLDGRYMDDTLLEEMKAHALVRTRVTSIITNDTPSEETDNNTASTEMLLNPYQDIYSVAHSIIPDYAQMYDADADTLYAVWRQHLFQNMQTLRLTDGEMTYWHTRMEKIETPFLYEYSHGWSEIMGQFLTNSIFALMLIAVCLSGVFAEEHRLKTDQLILCTKHGRRLLFYAKIITGFLFGFGCAFALFAISFCFCAFYYGTAGFHAMLQTEIVFSPFAISIGEAVLLLFGLSLLAAVLESAAALFLSEYLNNAVAAMAILTGIMLLSQFVGVTEQLRVLSQIQGFLPTTFLAPWSFHDARLVPVFGGYLNCFQFAAILYFVCTVLFVRLGKRKYQRFQVTGR